VCYSKQLEKVAINDALQLKPPDALPTRGLWSGRRYGTDQIPFLPTNWDELPENSIFCPILGKTSELGPGPKFYSIF